MNSNKSRLEHMFRNCPDCLSVQDVMNWTAFGKNHVYSLINNGELHSYDIRGSRCIAKTDLINYLLAHSDDQNRRIFQLRKSIAKQTEKQRSDSNE